MHIPLFPQVPRLNSSGSKLVRREKPGIDRLGIPMGDCCAFGITSTNSIMSGLCEWTRVKSSSNLFNSWSQFVYKTFKCLDAILLLVASQLVGRADGPASACLDTILPRLMYRSFSPAFLLDLSSSLSSRFC